MYIAVTNGSQPAGTSGFGTEKRLRNGHIGTFCLFILSDLWRNEITYDCALACFYKSEPYFEQLVSHQSYNFTPLEMRRTEKNVKH